MDRDDFSKRTRDYLAMRVGVRCSNPSCRKLTTGPRSESPFIVNIGVAAHITGASLGGPRCDSDLSPQQRKSPENGIWLCQNCAKLIDNDTKHYSAPVLLEWRSKAEASAHPELEGKGAPQLPDSSAEIDLSYSRDQISQELHDYCLRIKLTNCGTEPICTYNVDLSMPAVVLSRPEAHPLYLPENSTRDIAFFRVSSSDRENLIYPGDCKVVISIRYHLDSDLYWGDYNRASPNHRSHVDLFKQPLKVTLYHYGFRPITVERRFWELQAS